MDFGGLHGDSLVKIIRKPESKEISVRIADYLPTDFLENTFDRMYTRQSELVATRRKTTLWKLETSTTSLLAGPGTFIAGLYSERPISSLFKTPYIRVILNEKDIASRRRFLAELVFDDEEEIKDFRSKTLFPKKRPFTSREKSFYHLGELGSFIEKAISKDIIDVVVGIRNCWVSDNIREKSQLKYPEFVPVIPIETLKVGGLLVSPKYVVVREDYSISLQKIQSLTSTEGVHDLYSPKRGSYSHNTGPTRGAFTANNVIVFHPFTFFDPYDLAEELIDRESKEKRREILQSKK